MPRSVRDQVWMTLCRASEESGCSTTVDWSTTRIETSKRTWQNITIGGRTSANSSQPRRLLLLDAGRGALGAGAWAHLQRRGGVQRRLHVWQHDPCRRYGTDPVALAGTGIESTGLRGLLALE